MEFHLHAGIYRARPDVHAIVHGHPQWSTYLSMAGQPYLPVYAQGALLHPMPLLDTPASINDPDIADRLATVLGDRPAAMLKSHGTAVTGADIIEAFVLATYLEENVRRHYMAAALGAPYVFTEAECVDARTRLQTPKLFEKAWDHFAARLDVGGAGGLVGAARAIATKS
jgi:ribulose-5-phosphate 4-epimerase/fuculose-1-phosphate aldolase